jgi:Zn-dependent protease
MAMPMPFLRGLIATQLAVAAFALIPSAPLDGDRLAKRPLAAAMLSFASAAAALALATGVI